MMIFLLIATSSILSASSGTCWLSVAGLNQERFVWGPVNVECGWEPGGCWHSAPWGNWGVTSNYGHKQDGTQFQGWKGTGWKKEWNSCTDGYSPPNCTYYNWNNCTQQRSFSGVNVHGTKGFGAWVNCPQDTTGDGMCDTGGCLDVYSFGEWNNWMTLYELDPAIPWPWCGKDDLVETLYFPPTVVHLTCDVSGCWAAGSSWMTPSSGSWATHAEMAMVVNFGVYYDSIDCEYLRFANPQYDCYW
jgi:hypothetical protein